jgi:hypothetical protein
MRIATLIAAVVCVMGGSAIAQERAPEPIPIEAWSLERISAMGIAIYEQDTAAWVSTDALLAHLGNTPPPTGMVGWVVVQDGQDHRVRYVRQDGNMLKAAFDVVVREGRAGPVENVDVPVSEYEAASFRARQTAMANAGDRRCAPQLNAVVVDDPDSDEWLVWLLTPTSQQTAVPVGGHIRFRISADGSTVLRRDLLSVGCLNMPRPPQAEEGQPQALFVMQIVSDTPVETHVFLSLQNRLPIFVMAGEQVFLVAGAQISKVDQ